MPRDLPGPVTNVQDRSALKRQRKANKGSFTKERPGPGRPLAGVNGSNKQGVAGFVLDLSIDTPTSAAALLGRLSLVDGGGTLDGTIVVVHRDETAADEPPHMDSPNTDK